MTSISTQADATIVVLAGLALLLPLFSFLLSLVVKKSFEWLAPLLASLLLLITAVSSVALLISRWNESSLLIHMDWFDIAGKPIQANLLLSNQSILMLFVVSFISFLVHLYSIGYMAGDTNSRRYFAMLGFFTFSMQGIVLSDSLLVIFIFWELVGFASYLLIGHYAAKIEAAKAAKKAFIMNRLGDAGFIVGLMIVWLNTGSFNLTDIVATDTASWQTAASLCIFCGVMGKSAQFPLFTWLPDAMEGPTPVSALIHAATMVAAGVYLMVRIFPIFTTDALVFIAVIGAVTSLLAALAALSQYDIKKILAYSTISQLGLMVIALGLGNPAAAMLHLFTHAFFKAGLFLCAGSLIYVLHQAQQQSQTHFDEQDVRNMGGLFRKLPVTAISFIICAASLAGVPFFSGFLSKEAIITAVWVHNNTLSWIMLSTIGVISFLTVLYTFRVVWFVFFGEERTIRNLQVSEVPPVMRTPVILLASCSLWFIVSFHPFDFAGWINPVESHSSAFWITIGSSLWVAVAFLTAWIIFRNNTITSNKWLRNNFYIDNVYQQTFQKVISPLSSTTNFTDTKLIDGFIHLSVYGQVTLAHIVGGFDRYVVDGIVHLIANISATLGTVIRSFQSGKIQVYIFWAAFTIIIFLICVLK